MVVDASVDDPTKVGAVNGEIVETVIPKILAEFPGVEIIQRGQGERSEKALMSMQINVMILFVVMIIIMSLNFESVWQALLILLVVPAGVAGGILGHSIIGIPVSILSAFGMIALIGILINDSIVFLDTYNRNVLKGLSVRDAVVDAARSRFRPILLTSVTTVAGLLPLILETSFQAQFLIPMAVSIAFGLLFGTVFILFFFPAVILVHNDMRRVFHRMLNDNEYEIETKEKGDLAKLLHVLGHIFYYVVGAVAALGGLALIIFTFVNGWSKGFILLGIVLSGLGTAIFLLKNREKAIMMKTQLTIAMFVIPVVLVTKGLEMLDADVLSSLFIGGGMIVAAAFFVAFLPLGLFEKLIKLIWQTEELPEARGVEPILINKKHQAKRDLSES
jgi:hypothetical protein